MIKMDAHRVWTEIAEEVETETIGKVPGLEPADTGHETAENSPTLVSVWHRNILSERCRGNCGEGYIVPGLVVNAVYRRLSTVSSVGGIGFVIFFRT